MPKNQRVNTPDTLSANIPYSPKSTANHWAQSNRIRDTHSSKPIPQCDHRRTRKRMWYEPLELQTHIPTTIRRPTPPLDYHPSTTYRVRTARTHQQPSKRHRQRVRFLNLVTYDSTLPRPLWHNTNTIPSHTQPPLLYFEKYHHVIKII